MRAIFCLLLAGSMAVVAAPQPELGSRYRAEPNVGAELIGTMPPEWSLTDWQNSEPLTLQSLRGKVVLIRWWTAPTCPYCAASANALEEWARKYRSRGLVVVGAYHHKADTPFTADHVRTQAERLGFDFPVAIDHEWRTPQRWWLDNTDRGWTSVTFLLGRDGKIRHIHGGGAYYKDEPGYEALEKAITEALE